MGQKVNPTSFRLQVHKNWDSRWFAHKKDFARLLIEDIKIREHVEKRFESRPTIARVEIERSANLVTVTIHTAKAGVVIGRGGAGVTELKTELEKLASLPVRINIEEVKADNIAVFILNTGYVIFFFKFTSAVVLTQDNDQSIWISFFVNTSDHLLNLLYLVK